MRTPLVALGLAALSVLALVPAGEAASHGLVWTANGYAVNAAGNVVAISVYFSGQFCYPSYYRVTLSSVGGGVLEQRTFPGYEYQTQVGVSDAYENTFNMYGNDIDPTVDFAWSGAQVNTIISGLQTLNGVIEGHYGGYTFAAATVLHPFQFFC
jgi:hypothetical protein